MLKLKLALAALALVATLFAPSLRFAHNGAAGWSAQPAVTYACGDPGSGGGCGG